MKVYLKLLPENGHIKSSINTYGALHHIVKTSDKNGMEMCTAKEDMEAASIAITSTSSNTRVKWGAFENPNVCPS